jgi:hypothetical protein
MMNTLEIEEGLDLELAVGVANCESVSAFLDWNELVAGG